MATYSKGADNMMIWQHVEPQPPEACDADPIKPYDILSKRPVCASLTCGQPIKRVSASEGPEALKSLLRF